MNYLKTGIFYGDTFKTLRLDGITLTDTEYTHDFVDWHYHENTYFTFLLEGKLLEGNKKDKQICGPGTLLYHGCQEPHYNIKPDSGYARGFHIEINETWLDDLDLTSKFPAGSFGINNPVIVSLFRKIHSELCCESGSLEIEFLLTEVYRKMLNITAGKNDGDKSPSWLKELTEILNDASVGNFRFNEIAATIGVHPVHLSRDFKKYFNCSMGEYIRKLKIQKALKLMADGDLTLTQIAHSSGFADQSHFIKWFRYFTGVNPSYFRKKFSSEC